MNRDLRVITSVDHELWPRTLCEAFLNHIHHIFKHTFFIVHGIAKVELKF